MTDFTAAALGLCTPPHPVKPPLRPGCDSVLDEPEYGPLCPLISLDAVFEELYTVRDKFPARPVEDYAVGWRRAAGAAIDAIAHRFLVADGIIPAADEAVQS